MARSVRGRRGVLLLVLALAGLAAAASCLLDSGGGFFHWS
jgi:hypothetical protein